MPGTLFVVATPIGNLEDITIRALRVLREVGLVAAEDTRRTLKLLSHHNIRTPMTSLHEHNERRKTPALVNRLLAGTSIALVSDAGTPLLSDPGLSLVRAAIDAGVRVESIPGASAIISAVVSSGKPASEFTFLGFPPKTGSKRTQWFRRLAAESPRLLVMFESPQRIRRTLQDIAKELGDPQVAAAREMTKVHEEILRGAASELAGLAPEVGEYTLVVSVVKGPIREALPGSLAAAVAEFGETTKTEGVSRRDALARVADRHNISKRELYAAIEQRRN